MSSQSAPLLFLSLALLSTWPAPLARSATRVFPCETIHEFGTGMSSGGSKLRDGSVDPFFDGVSANFPDRGNVYVPTNVPTAWLADSASADSQWVAPILNPAAADAGTYGYRLRFVTPCAGGRVTGRFAASDRAAIFFNGSDTHITTPTTGWTNWTPFSLASLPAGTNTLEFYVTNAPTFVGPPGPTGLRAELAVVATCCPCIVLDCPANLLVTNCSATAPVFYTITGTNRCDTNLFINCTPPSGSAFPAGTTTVSCLASDNASHRTNCSFTVTVVRDSREPEIRCPGDIVYLCSVAGTNVFFHATATDDTDPAPVVTCVPPSGSFFPSGTTAVTCEARDACGRLGKCSFKVVIAPNSFTKTIQAGVADNFSLAGPEFPSAGPCLATSGEWSGMPFDTSWPGRNFAHSFMGLPANITGAKLTIHMRPTQPASQDDLLRIGLVTCNPPAIWSFSKAVALLPGAGGTWSANPAKTFTLDLAALPGGMNLLPKLNADHRLDISVGRETMVDHARLELSYCGPLTTLSGVPYSLTGAPPIHQGDGVSWRVVNSNSPVQIDLDIGQADGIRFDFDLPPLCPGIGSHHGLSTDWPTGEGTTATLAIDASATAGQTRISMSQPSNITGKAVEVWNAGQLVSRYFLAGSGDTAVCDVASTACLFQMGFSTAYFFANFTGPVPVRILTGNHISGQVGPVVNGDTVRLYYVITVNAPAPSYPHIVLRNGSLDLAGLALQQGDDWLKGFGNQTLNISDVAFSKALFDALLHPYGDCSPAYGPWILNLNGVAGFCTWDANNLPVCNNGAVDVRITGPGNGITPLNFGGLRLTPTALPLDNCHIECTVPSAAPYSVTVNRVVGGPITFNNVAAADFSHWPVNVTGGPGPQSFGVSLPANTTVTVGAQTFAATGATFTATPTLLGEFYQVCIETTFQQQMSFKSYHSTGTNLPPDCLTLTCPTNVIVTCTNPLGTVVTFAPSGATRCGSNVVVTCVPPSGTAFPPGVSVVHCAAIDSQGNQDQCRFLVTVRDTTAPQLLTPDRIIVPCQGPRGAVVDYASGALDQCDPSPVVVCNPPSGSLFPVGTTYVVCNAIDAEGNRSSVEFPVIVNGGCGTNTCLSLTLPEDIATNCTTTGGAVVGFTATARDNCTGGNLAVACVPASGSLFPVGLTRVICTTTSGVSVVSASFMVEVTDDVPPQGNCPSNRVVAAQSPLGAVVSYTTSATDDCTPASRIAVRCSPPSGSVFPVGETPVLCEFADGSGNRSRCVFTITVSPPPPLRATLLSSNRIELKWTGDAAVEATDELSDNPAWRELGGAVLGDGSVRTMSFTPTGNQRYFRILPRPLLPPADRDGDGVPDVRDRCPDTPAGLPVDAYGCAVFDLVGSPDLALGPEQAQLRKIYGGLLSSSVLSNIAFNIPNPYVSTCNVVVLMMQRDLPHALVEQSNVVRGLGLALTEFQRVKALRLAELEHLAPLLAPEHADVRELDVEMMEFDEVEQELVDSLSKNQHALTGLSNVVRATGSVLPRERVKIRSLDTIRGAMLLEDGRRVLLPKPGSPGAPDIGSILDAIEESGYADVQISRLEDGTYFGNSVGSASGVSSTPVLALDPRCLALRVTPVDFGLPDFDLAPRHKLHAYKWGFTENLSHHYLEFGMAFAAVKINCAAEVPGTFKHWIQIKQDSDHNGSFFTMVDKLDETSTPFVLKADAFPQYTAFKIQIREFRAPIVVCSNGPSLGQSELVYEDVQTIELNPAGTYAEAFYNRTVFDLADLPSETGHGIAWVEDLGLRFPLTLKPLNEMSFLAGGFRANGNASTYPSVLNIGLNDPFAVHFRDPNEFTFFANPDDFDKGLTGPTLSGYNHAKPFTYRVRLPFIARDRLHDCGGGNSYGDPDCFYRIPFQGLYSISQGNNGSFTHNGKQRYAFDFPKAAGTTVLAARGGRVVGLRESSSQSCWNPNAQNPDGTTGACQNCSGAASANFVKIKHRDGTLGVYFHFRLNGVAVNNGQRVYRGMPLGFVGTTGCSTGNHLHFHVVTPDDDGTTIPIRFESFLWPVPIFEECYLPPSNSQGFSTNIQQ